MLHHVTAPNRLSDRDVRTAYIVEGIACFGTNLLLLGVYFYTHARLGWTLKQNFMLAAGQGLVGAVGALLASPISGRFSRRGALIGIYAGMTLLPAALLVASSPRVITALLLLYTLAASFNWPMLESLVTTGVPADQLSRRVGAYNLVWSGASAVIIAASGLMIKHVPSLVFVVPIVVHGASVVLVWTVREPVKGDGHAAASGAHAEPGLLALRRLALALSRVSLPATYVLIYSLMAMMPSLPVIRTLTPTMATLVSSVWMASRWVTFLVLGATAWWHARPRILLASAVAMAPAFLGVAVPGARVWAWSGASVEACLAWMIAAQMLLGVCVGVIYSGSLYFGMALSEGSTEHGGYHEALINFGSAVGPIAGLLAETFYPENVPVAIASVSVVIGVSVLATVGTALAAGGKRP